MLWTVGCSDEAIKLVRALGLDPAAVVGLTIRIRADEAITATVELGVDVNALPDLEALIEKANDEGQLAIVSHTPLTGMTIKKLGSAEILARARAAQTSVPGG